MDDQLAHRMGALRGAFPRSQDGEAPDAETILGGISDGIVALDNEWRLVYANQAATRIWGRDLTMFMGKVIHDSLGIPEGNKFRLAYMASKHNGETIAFAGYSEIFAAWVDVRGYPAWALAELFGLDRGRIEREIFPSLDMGSRPDFLA